MAAVKAKKRLGQHFLKDRNVAERIAMSLTGEGYSNVIEVGPGTGILTRFLIGRNFSSFIAVEIDRESVEYLKGLFGDDLKLIHGDFLRLDLPSLFSGSFAIIGNFPYNISSQIFFRAIEYRDHVVELTGMIQKEVAERIHAGPGSRQYGILSVLVQAWFNTEILFTVPPHLFIPQPGVNSAVIRLRRNNTERLGCDEDLFVRVVKCAFNQRRKTLRNALGGSFDISGAGADIISLRAEKLSVDDYAGLTKIIEKNRHHGNDS